MRCPGIIAAGLLMLTAVARAAEPPSAVSPGSAERIEETNSRCPTFSWSSDDEASSYELAVFAVDGRGLDPEPVLIERIEGGALSWTPPLVLCLEVGETYAWAVRAMGGASTRWSEVKVFRIPAGPTRDELKRSLAVLEVADAERAREATAARETAENLSTELETEPTAVTTQEPQPILVLPLNPALSLDSHLIVGGGAYYLTPRTRKVRIAPPDFVFEGDDRHLDRDAVQLYVENTAFATKLYAPVHAIPDGAEITGFECRVKDQSAAYHLTCSLWRSSSDSAVASSWIASTFGLAPSASIQTITDPMGIATTVVGDERIWVEYEVSDFLCDFECVFHSATITYRVNRVD